MLEQLKTQPGSIRWRVAPGELLIISSGVVELVGIPEPLSSADLGGRERHRVEVEESQAFDFVRQ